MVKVKSDLLSVYFSSICLTWVIFLQPYRVPMSKSSMFAVALNYMVLSQKTHSFTQIFHLDIFLYYKNDYHLNDVYW